MVVPGFERQNLNTIASAYIGLLHISASVGIEFLAAHENKAFNSRKIIGHNILSIIRRLYRRRSVFPNYF
jgi:hypothetical protein